MEMLPHNTILPFYDHVEIRVRALIACVRIEYSTGIRIGDNMIREAVSPMGWIVAFLDEMNRSKKVGRR